MNSPDHVPPPSPPSPRPAKALELVAVILSIGLGALALSGCETAVSLASRRSCDWEFIQAVGGIAISAPKRDRRGHVLLPIRCDVSGTTAITCRPTTLNSMCACERPLVRVQGNTIAITVRTALASNGSDYRCPAADLGGLPTGTYPVVYRSPDGHEHPLGVIHLPPQ